MANTENLKPFTKLNAKEMGRRGGIASGKSRKEKAYIKHSLTLLLNIQNYINSLSNIEFETFVCVFSLEQQSYIRTLFKPSKKEIRQILKKFK
ncbi:hypothetical protein [Methanobrevibacter sp.]|uniref:hypothetical protein n=1 Tax=Methanobrevibacter sp. TaxID=66852 RepID=UPI0025DB71CC|nr:hypothetical protein [Methanobrevibacter sp.]MBQ2962378.1 hypothetical protein [Methanobrevibacter sp.]